MHDSIVTTSKNTAFLDFPGEMARLIREKDWTETPFGPIEGWSSALRSAVSIILGSRFPMVLYWGETRALIYNDAWAPVPGQKHPWALGRPGYEVWAEIWNIIGPMFDQVMDQGIATWSDDQLLPLNRFGYVEECFFYYSYSPVRGEDGRVEGVFTAVTETTPRVLAERRERLLREISEATSNTRSAEDACRVMTERIAVIPEEAPFLLAYLRDETGALRLAGKAGAVSDNDLAPDDIPTDGHPIWPVAQALAEARTIRVSTDTWQGCTDLNQLENALLNLCINARNAMPEGGDLIIATENRTMASPSRRRADQLDAGDYVIVSVSDTGSGMDEATLGRVFEPFFTTKPIGKGTGLGLSMIYGFAQQTKGTVEIDSASGDGTTVRLVIPRSTGSEVVDCSEDGVALGGGETVLVVEDEVSCPLLSGPSTMTVWIKEGTTNAFEEAQAGGDHRQAA